MTETSSAHTDHWTQYTWWGNLLGCTGQGGGIVVGLGGLMGLLALLSVVVIAHWHPLTFSLDALKSKAREVLAVENVSIRNHAPDKQRDFARQDELKFDFSEMGMATEVNINRPNYNEGEREMCDGRIRISNPVVRRILLLSALSVGFLICGTLLGSSDRNLNRWLGWCCAPLAGGAFLWAGLLLIHRCLGALAGVHVARFAADVGFVHFDIARELAARLVLHGQANPVQHEPRGFLSDAKRGRQFVRTDTVLHVDDHPDGRKPLAQPDRGILKDRPGLKRELAVRVPRGAFPAVPRRIKIDLLGATRRAGDAVRPAQAHHVVQAVRGVREVFDRFDEGAGLGVRWLSHSSKYGLYASEVPPSSMLCPNILPSCWTCNSVKGKRTSVEFLALLAERKGVFVRFTERQRVWLFAKYSVLVPIIPEPHTFDFWGHRNTPFRIVDERITRQGI